MKAKTLKDRLIDRCRTIPKVKPNRLQSAVDTLKGIDPMQKAPTLSSRGFGFDAIAA